MHIHVYSMYDGPSVKEQIKTLLEREKRKLFIFTIVLGGEKINLYFFYLLFFMTVFL